MLRNAGTIQSYINNDIPQKEDFINDYINNTETKDNEEVSPETISKLEKLIPIAPKLELTIKDSLYLDVGLKININSLGLVEKSLRKIKDGITYFGIAAPDENKEDINIDFSTINTINNIINSNETQINYGRQFRIRFDIDENCYFIKDCSQGVGYGTCMKIVKEIKIKDNTLINIGENYIVFTFGSDEGEQNENNIENEKILNVKVFSGETHNYSYVFNQSQSYKIYIGKNINCNIVLNDDSLEDIHCRVEYKKGFGWVLNDGYNDKNSEKGTWLCLSEEKKIFEGMIIQSNQNLFECHLIN